jgi:hypothetical protein
MAGIFSDIDNAGLSCARSENLGFDRQLEDVDLVNLCGIELDRGLSEGKRRNWLIDNQEGLVFPCDPKAAFGQCTAVASAPSAM